MSAGVAVWFSARGVEACWGPVEFAVVDCIEGEAETGIGFRVVGHGVLFEWGLGCFCCFSFSLGGGMVDHIEVHLDAAVCRCWSGVGLPPYEWGVIEGPALHMVIRCRTCLTYLAVPVPVVRVSYVVPEVASGVSRVELLVDPPF